MLPRLTTILVAPVTTRERQIPTEIPLGMAHGLPRRCVANFDHILPLPKESLVRRIGRLTGPELQQVCRAARFAIGC